MTIPIIDLFAGPGGLGEGFSQVGWKEDDPFFRIGLSVEMDPAAHRTLKLRSFVRQFPYKEIPEEYYEMLREGRNPDELFSMEKFAEQSEAAHKEAWRATLRDDEEFNKDLDEKINEILKDREDWVLIGGPPCQAYSVAGRVRNKGIAGYLPEEDHRHFLYKEYLRIIAVHRPAIFIMENVRGILSSKINGNCVFERILKDLRNPSDDPGCRYRIFSLSTEAVDFEDDGDPVFSKNDFVIASEKHGIPQARHRVILLGMREDLFRKKIKPLTLAEENQVSFHKVLSGLPSLRSGLSRGKYDKYDWKEAVSSFPVAALSHEICNLSGFEVEKKLREIIAHIPLPHADMGADFVNRKPRDIKDETLADWYQDERLAGVLNHTARTHMAADLHRYLYAACYAKEHSRSPRILEFPERLKPEHRNRDSGHFKDRFRVQLPGRPSCTITSHISKDGHYYIHPDPRQCRSLTVREAARLQTFPDNYFFCGNRTQQYVQVGNAVPPLLAHKIAEIVKKLLIEAGIG